MYTNDTIDRFLFGGDIYAANEASYGTENADLLAALAAGGDPIAVANATNQMKNGAARPTGTAGLFWGQISTDPLAAPLAGANNILGNSLASLFKNPLVLIALVAVAFFAFGGANLIRNRLK